MRRIAFAFAVSDHDNLATRSYGIRNLLVIGGFLRCALATFPRLILVRQVMQEVMGVIRPDDMFRSVARGHVNMKNLRPVVVHHDQKTGFHWRLVGSRRRWAL